MALKVMSPMQIMSDELKTWFSHIAFYCIINHRIELINLKELMISLMIKMNDQL